MSSNLDPTQGKRFVGLDAIRFVCAFVVVLSHSPGVVTFAGQGGRAAVLAAKVARDAWNGPASVIVFFVISGFCIHLPYRDGKRIGLDYFLRRYIRIGAPLGAVLLISPYFGLPTAELLNSVLWSLYCELVYYTIYPILVRIAGRIGWGGLTSGAFLFAFVWVVLRPNPFGSYTSANVLSDSITGLPCWLIGCLIADRKLPPTPSTPNIWLWRAAVFFSSILALELQFHTPVHHQLTLNFFGLLTMFWLSRELSYHEKTQPWSWLERAGAWSYSLYVFHGDAIRLPRIWFPHWPDAAQWALRIPLTLLSCYLFYRTIEKPSHRLARLAAAAVKSRAPVRG